MFNPTYFGKLKSVDFIPALKDLPNGQCSTVHCSGIPGIDLATIYVSLNGIPYFHSPDFDRDCYLWTEITKENRVPITFWSISTNLELLNEISQVAEMKESGEFDLESIESLIIRECNDLRDMLLEKNRLYGNSALDPKRIFSSADPIEQINVRIDDKLSRIESGQLDDTEDPEKDLNGYLILKRVAKKIYNKN